MEDNNKIVLFQEQQVRRVWHDEAWWFSVIDVVGILSESSIPSRYWNDLKRRVSKESGNKDLYAKCVKLKLVGEDGKSYPTECADTETLLRITMSIPSPKAEPFKQWLAQVGRERIEEIENPELAIEKVRALYQAKGYSDAWIERRVQSIETRKKLTDEWKGRGVKEGQEYSILTATIAKGTFGVTPSEHADLKGLEKQNLRDHMTDLELIFTALGEEVTRQLTIEADAQGFEENHGVATEGGKMTGRARENLESSMKTKVVSSKNYQDLTTQTSEIAPSDSHSQNHKP
jgi:DNA-damage-inducible protein D